MSRQFLNEFPELLLKAFNEIQPTDALLKVMDNWASPKSDDGSQLIVPKFNLQMVQDRSRDWQSVNVDPKASSDRPRSGLTDKYEVFKVDGWFVFQFRFQQLRNDKLSAGKSVQETASKIAPKLKDDFKTLPVDEKELAKWVEYQFRPVDAKTQETKMIEDKIRKDRLKFIFDLCGKDFSELA